MGIKHLNKYLIEKCKSIKKIHIKKFRNKKIVIDTSIYIYKFLSENALIERMYKMIKMFQEYNITPIFIFDGKPPPEKKELLIRRNQLKYQAQEKYNELISQNSGNESELQNLKNQFLKISETHINQVKDLFKAMGVKYFVSTTESDPICVYLVNSNKVCGCLTEDMDMFVYGCHHILRNIDIDTHEIQYYNIHSILKELNVTYLDFKQILVLSGTDYNIQSTTNLYKTLALFDRYKSSYFYNRMTFYEWLKQCNSYYIKDRDKLNHCYEMFDLCYYMNELESFITLNEKDLSMSPPNIDTLTQLSQLYGFCVA